MKKNEAQERKVLFWTLGILCFLSFLAQLAVFPRLPDNIPIHWGINGAVDNWGPKGWILFFGMLPLILLLFMIFVPKINPQKHSYGKSPVYLGFMIGTTLIFLFFSWLTVLFALKIIKEAITIPRVILGVIGVYMIALGNYVPRIKQNRYFGIKTPWAFKDQSNWKKTQRAGGIVFIFAGVLMICSALFFTPALVTVTMVLIFGGTAGVFLYSYLLYRKNNV